MKVVLSVLRPFIDLEIIEIFESTKDVYGNQIFNVNLDGDVVCFGYTEDGIWDVIDNEIVLPVKAIIYAGDLIESILKNQQTIVA